MSHLTEHQQALFSAFQQARHEAQLLMGNAEQHFKRFRKEYPQYRLPAAAMTFE